MYPGGWLHSRVYDLHSRFCRLSCRLSSLLASVTHPHSILGRGRGTLQVTYYCTYGSILILNRSTFAPYYVLVLPILKVLDYQDDIWVAARSCAAGQHRRPHTASLVQVYKKNIVPLPQDGMVCLCFVKPRCY